MTPAGAVALAVLAAALLALGVLTALGARRRGSGRPLAALAGLFFPVTWVAWYVRDGGVGQRHAASGRLH